MKSEDGIRERLDEVETKIKQYKDTGESQDPGGPPHLVGERNAYKWVLDEE